MNLRRMFLSPRFDAAMAAIWTATALLNAWDGFGWGAALGGMVAGLFAAKWLVRGKS